MTKICSIIVDPAVSAAARNAREAGGWYSAVQRTADDGGMRCTVHRLVMRGWQDMWWDINDHRGDAMIMEGHGWHNGEVCGLNLIDLAHTPDMDGGPLLGTDLLVLGSCYAGSDRMLAALPHLLMRPAVVVGHTGTAYSKDCEPLYPHMIAAYNGIGRANPELADALPDWAAGRGWRAAVVEPV